VKTAVYVTSMLMRISFMVSAMGLQQVQLQHIKTVPRLQISM
jgi:hypothetical protein